MRLHHCRCSGLRFASLAAWLALTLCASGMAQEPAPAENDEPPVSEAAAESSDEPKAPDPLPGEIFPRVFYLPDKDGKLRAMPGFDLSEFQELYDLKHKLVKQNRPPKYSIKAISISGATDGPRADLTADFTIAVHETGWLQAPLRLEDAVLREPPSFDGPGEHVSDLAEDGSGYVVWIRSEAETTHRVKLRLWAPIERVGAESHLRLHLPRSPATEMQLRVPLAKVVARISEGNTLDSVTPTSDGKSLLEAVGLGGEIDLSWNATDSPVPKLPTVLEATGAITIRVDGQNIRSDAKLTVRSSGGDFDRFTVQLPPDTDYIPSAQVGATVVELDTDGEQGKQCEVRLAEPTTGPVEIRLMSQRANGRPSDDDVLELAGFEVVDAVRQWGTVTVSVSGNWQAQWITMRHIRQTDELTGLMGGDESTAAFEYSVQPFSLTARIRPQQTRIRVEANYVVDVGSEEAELQARLKYFIRGAKVRALEVDAPGWDVDQIGPASLVNIDGVAASQNNPLIIPLRQLTSGEVEITFTARQEVDPQRGTVALGMPVPRGQSVASADVTIVAADHVELLMSPDETVDLATQSIRPDNLDLPARQQEPFFLRTTGDAPLFNATATVHQQEIKTSVATQLRVDDRSTQVDQRIGYQVLYEPTDRVMLGVPRALRPDRMTITLDGQRLSPTVGRDRDTTQPSRRRSDLVPMHVDLPSPRIGDFELNVEYDVPHDLPDGESGKKVTVPLVVPGDGELMSNTLVAMPSAGVSMTVPDGPWTADVGNTNRTMPGALALSAASALPEVGIALSAEQRRKEDATRIEQAWIQSRLTDSWRQDRAVFRLATSEANVGLTLPEGADPASLELRVDGRRAQHQRDSQAEADTIVVPLGTTPGGKHLLDLRYRFMRRPSRGRLALEGPRIESATWVRQLYWQLVLPETEHVFGTPPNFVREYRWARANVFWHRMPSLSDRELEQWIGAATPTGSQRLEPVQSGSSDNRLSPAPSATNEYLYSAFGAAEPLEVYTIRRSWLVLMASLPLLVFGLLLIYVPAARHPAALLVAAIALAATSLIDPESIRLLAQAASLGLLLTLVAIVLARMAARPSVTTASSHGSSQAIERPFSEVYPRPQGSGSQPSTATNPLLPSSAPESHS